MKGLKKCIGAVTAAALFITALPVNGISQAYAATEDATAQTVDVEGKAQGIEQELVRRLGEWGKIPITYAGGVSSQADLQLLRNLGQDCLNVTIGSALDLFGGPMKFEDVLRYAGVSVDKENRMLVQ